VSNTLFAKSALIISTTTVAGADFPWKIRLLCCFQIQLIDEEGPAGQQPGTGLRCAANWYYPAKVQSKCDDACFVYSLLEIHTKQRTVQHVTLYTTSAQQQAATIRIQLLQLQGLAMQKTCLPVDIWQMMPM
jgi:hypothetical protein